MSAAPPYRPPRGGVPRILHLDRWFIAVEKPAGLLTVPGRGPERADCLLSRLARAHPEARVIHRLDMATSGLVLFAREARAQAAFGRLFERREIRKTYEAVVAGVPRAACGLIELPLRADWPRRPRQCVDFLRGRPATTFWRRRAVLPGERALLRLFPLTGRSHQLRVHLLALGHPVLGDRLYGSGAVAEAAERMLLHAVRLRFRHPFTGAWIDLRSPAPFG